VADIVLATGGAPGPVGSGFTQINWRATRAHGASDNDGVGAPLIHRILRNFGVGFNQAALQATVPGDVISGVTGPSLCYFQCPRAGTLKRLFGCVEIGMPLDYTWTVVLMTLSLGVWSVTDTPLSITIPAGSAATFSDLTHTQAVSRGDKVAVICRQGTGTNSSNTTNPQASLLLV
jgi:hypothetical protein